jgi:multiple sugar transport system permease protein
MKHFWQIPKSIIFHLLIYAAALATVAPFIWMVLTSFKNLGEILVYPPKWLPEKFQIENYMNAFRAAPFARFYFNSVFVATAVTLGQLITCSMAAFAFARLKFWGVRRCF